MRTLTTSCLLCDSPQTELYYHKSQNTYHKDFRICTSCGYVFTWPRISVEQYLSYYRGDYAKDVYALGEDEASVEEAISWRTRSSKMKIDFFASFYPKGGRALEIGSGLGTFLKELRDRFHMTVRGVELSPQFAKIASQRFGIETFLGDASDFFKTDKRNSYDVIVMDQVLEHLYDPLSLLREVKKKLTPKGLLYVGVPNLSSPAAAKPDFFIPEHVSYFSPHTLALLVKQAGFRIIDVALPEFASMHFLLQPQEARRSSREARHRFLPLSAKDFDTAFASFADHHVFS